MPSLHSNYDDFVAGIRRLASDAVPRKEMIDEVRDDILYATQNVNPFLTLAILTQLAKGAEQARQIASAAVIAAIQGNNSPSATPFNNGKNFTSSGLASPLVFRDAVEADYNYASNDDLDPSEFGNRTFGTIQSDENTLRARLKLLTKEKKLRAENILFAHPRMQASNIKHKLSFIGTQAEVLRNAELATNN